MQRSYCLPSFYTFTFTPTEFDLSRCRRTVEPLHLLDYTGTALRVLLLSAVLLFSTYLARSRKLICDYFYHRYGKERTLFLYNDRLRRRRAYLKQRKAQLAEAIRVIYGGREGHFEPCYRSAPVAFAQDDHLLKRLILAFYYWSEGKRCFVCLKAIALPYIACDTPTCLLLYCQVCFADVGGRCLNCRRRQKEGRFAILD